jgi:muramoyltetrapeptide carboxypeptidase
MGGVRISDHDEGPRRGTVAGDELYIGRRIRFRPACGSVIVVAVPDALLLAPALRAGDLVAVVAPSWCGPAVIPTPFRRGVARLEALGYRVRLMPNVQGRGRWEWVSGTPAERAGDLQSAFADPEVRAVMCAIGGNHSAQLLPLLDMDLIAANPKVFCGYSDITSLHHGIHSATGLVTFYGPAVIPQWGAVGGPFDYTVKHFQRVVGRPEAAGRLPRADVEVHDGDFDAAEATGAPLRRTPARPRVVLRAGRGSGPLLAACLPSARHLLGTRWQPAYVGRVLVLETPEPPYDLEKADEDLTHLRLAGCLDQLAALVLCRPYQFDEATTEALHDLLMEHVRGHDYPVLGRVEGGHTDPLPTFPIGVRATVDADELTFDWPAVAGVG